MTPINVHKALLPRAPVNMVWYILGGIRLLGEFKLGITYTYSICSWPSEAATSRVGFWPTGTPLLLSFASDF